MQFLLFMPLALDEHHFHHALVRSATAFLEPSGPVTASVVGVFERLARKRAEVERVELVLLEQAVTGDAPERARALESVLRTTATAAGVRAGDVRVFAATEGSAA